MLHPVGSHAPGVYWRRRAALIAAAVVLVLLTAWVLRPGGGDSKPVAGTPASRTSAPAPSTSAGDPSTSAASSSGSGTGAGSSAAGGAAGPGGSTSRHSGAHGSTSVVPKPCAATALQIAAVTGSASYRVGDQPVVMLQVTNSGTTPCVQDLADAQIELRVYNGESRVWGSHDCEIQPGTDPRTIAAGQSVRVSITWSGLSSQPSCAGTRQRVGAGTYTLYASLSGREGTAAQFSIT